MCPWAYAQRVIFWVLEHTLKGSFFGSLSKLLKGHFLGLSQGDLLLQFVTTMGTKCHSMLVTLSPGVVTGWKQCISESRGSSVTVCDHTGTKCHSILVTLSPRVVTEWKQCISESRESSVSVCDHTGTKCHYILVTLSHKITNIHTSLVLYVKVNKDFK